jgi:hypothetical protein
MRLGVVFGPDQITEAVRPIRIGEQRIQGCAADGMVPSMLFERLLDLLLESLPRVPSERPIVRKI